MLGTSWRSAWPWRPGTPRIPAGPPRAPLELVGARSAAVRRYANTFFMTDDCGRLLVLSAEDLRLVREAKV